jgi:DNA-binding SARP family transcriptional activator
MSHLGSPGGEKNPARARGALRQSLYNLRNLLGSRILSSRGDEEVGLAFDILDCDVVSFEEALAHGADQEALDTYGGDLLEGFFISGAPTFERWLEQRRDDLRVQARDAAWRLAARAQATGQPIEAAHWARRARQLAPLDEERRGDNYAPASRLASVLSGASKRSESDGSVASHQRTTMGKPGPVSST